MSIASAPGASFKYIFHGVILSYNAEAMRSNLIFAFLFAPAVAFADSVVVSQNQSSGFFHYRESIGETISDVYVRINQIVSVKVTTPNKDSDKQSTVEFLTNTSGGVKAEAEGVTISATHRLMFDTPEVAKKVADDLLYYSSLKEGEGYGVTDEAYVLGAGDGSLLVNSYRLKWQNESYPFLQAEFGSGHPEFERMARNVVECNHDGRYVIAKCGVNPLYPHSKDASMQFEKFEYWIFDTTKSTSAKSASKGPYALEEFTSTCKALGLEGGGKLRSVIEFK
jgi:hypothetical protein